MNTMNTTTTASNVTSNSPHNQTAKQGLNELKSRLSSKVVSEEPADNAGDENSSADDVYLVSGFMERVNLIRAKMATLPPFDRNPASLEAMWPAVEGRIYREPQLALGAVSWIARVFTKILMTRTTAGGLRVDPYVDDVIFHCEEVSATKLKELQAKRVPAAAIARTYVRPYFTTQAMESVVRAFERCQFQGAVVRARDKFQCTIQNGVPQLVHVVNSDTTDEIEGQNPIVNAYAYVRYDDDRLQPQVAIMGRERAASAKQRAQDAGNWESDDADVMWRKTVMRDLINSMPLCADLRSLFALQRGSMSLRMILEGN